MHTLVLRFVQGCVVALALLLLRVALVLLGCLRAHWQWKACPIPGPEPSSKLLGHLPQLAGPKGPWALAEMANAHGPIFKVQFLSEVQIVLTDPAAIAAVTRRTGPGPYLPKPRSQYKMLETALKPQIPSILTADDGDYWRAVRQATAPCFSTTNLKAVLPLVLELTQRVAERMADAVSAAASSKAPALFDVTDGAKRITIDVMGHMLLGEDLGLTRWEHSEYLEAFLPVLKAQGALISNPWHLLQLHKPEVRHQRRCLALHNTMMQDKTERLMAHPPADHTIAAHLLSTLDPATGKPLSRDQLKAEIAIFLAAGFETTSHAITWVLATLAACPDVQDAVLRELQGAGLAATAGQPGRDIGAADLGRLPYLSAVVKEALRLCPPAPWGGSRHVVTEGAVVCGHQLAKGTVVMLPTLPLGLATRNYADALRFRPERWLSPDDAAKHGDGGDGGDGGGSPPASPRPPDPYTFLTGPRDCVGQNLAKLELTVVLGTLLSRFAFAPGPALAAELATASALGQPVMTAVHALAGVHITMQPLAGELLLAVWPRA